MANLTTLKLILDYKFRSNFIENELIHKKSNKRKNLLNRKKTTGIDRVFFPCYPSSI